MVATDNFQHILRVLNTNVDGKQNIMYAMTSIRGIGRRFSNIVCKKAEVDLKKRCALQPIVSACTFLSVWLFHLPSRGSLLLCNSARAGELSAKELEELMVIVSNPRTFKIPDWFLNRQKDHKDGRFSQLTSSALDTKLREDLERLKKIR